MKVLVAMSGGVDSAVAAAIAAESGHEVVGVHMALMRNRDLLRKGSAGCCSIEDANDARRVCEQIGIPFYVWDLSEDFQKNVIADFLTEYREGRTPNPCIRCNEFVKFRTLTERALELGFDKIVTGHYAQVLPNAETGSLELHRSANLAKDQSYVLAVMARDTLEHCWFPLGAFNDKAEVRAEAERRGFKVSTKPDSTDICFIEKGQTQTYLQEHLGAKPGPILDAESGKVLGEHQGTYNFTIGQRKGINCRIAPANGEPRYVIATDIETGVVKVGSRDHLRTDKFTFKELNWLVDPSLFGAGLRESLTVQIRAHGEPLPCELRFADDGANQTSGLVQLKSTFTFDGVAPGQSAVFYLADLVVAQATIA